MIFIFYVHLYIVLASHTTLIDGKPTFDMDERRMHHSNYRVSHHMGQMKIKANPEGADFDFSGGDLHVDLRPAHSEVVPIFNYFHSDYHHYDVQPIEHHIEHQVTHHSGDDEYNMESHHGEDEEGYTRSYDEHHHGCHHHHHQLDPYEYQHLYHKQQHNNDERKGSMSMGNHHYMSMGNHHMSHHHHEQLDPYEHHHRHHRQQHDNDERHGYMCMDEHSSGHHDHHMEHNMMDHDEEEIESDHGHHEMPHVFPIGMMSVGEAHHMHHHDGGEGIYHEGDGMHHEHVGNEGLSEYVGDHHQIEGGNVISPGDISHHREETWGDNMGQYGGGDYGGHMESHGHHDCGYKKDSVNCTKEAYVKQKTREERGKTRGSALKPVGFSLDGSIRDKFKEHWNKEEEEQKHDSEGDNEESYSHHNNHQTDDERDTTDDVDKEPMRDDHHHRHDDSDDLSEEKEILRQHRHHRPKSNDDHEFSKPDRDAKPEAEEFMRNYNFPKKIYPEATEGSGGELKESAYKMQDALTGKERQLSDDIDRVERKQKKAREKNEEKDNVEKDIERREKEIQQQRRNAFSHNNDDDEGPDDPPPEKEGAKHHSGELRWNKEMSVPDIKHAFHIHPGKLGIHGEDEGHHGSHPGDEDIHGDHEGDHDKEAEEHEEEEHEEMNHEHDEHHDEEEEDKHAEEHEEEEHDHMNEEHDEHHNEEEEDREAEDHEDEEHEEMNDEHDHEEEHGHHHPKKISSEYEKYMDPEEKRQSDFHDSLTSAMMQKVPNFHSLEEPHDGVEKFEGNGEEIDINDRTKEGEFDEMMVQKTLDEDKNQLPIQNEGEKDALDSLGGEFKPFNAKKEVDNLQNGKYEQNQDPKLEGSDHEFYHDHDNHASMNHRKLVDTTLENLGLNDANYNYGDKRHTLKLKQPITVTGTQNDIVEPPHAEEELDKKILGDFKNRFNEETSFQSVEQAEELFNKLQDAAMTNQKKLDATQISGSVTDNGLVSRNTKKTDVGSKRYALTGNKNKIKPFPKSVKLSIMTGLEDARKLSDKVIQTLKADAAPFLKRNSVLKRTIYPNKKATENESFTQKTSKLSVVLKSKKNKKSTKTRNSKRHEVVFNNFFRSPIRTSYIEQHKTARDNQVFPRQPNVLRDRKRSVHSEDTKRTPQTISIKIPYF